MIRRLLLAAGLLAVPMLAAAAFEVIELRHRPVDELLPIVRPLIPERVAVSGDGYRLVVRGSRAEIEEVRAVVRRLDARARSLLIEVRRRSGRASAAEGIRGRGRLRADDDGVDASGRIRADSRQSRGAGSGYQSVRTVEGQTAFIDTGRSVPIRERLSGPGEDGIVRRETTRFRSVPEGFHATARVRGERVVVQLSTGSETWRGGGEPADRRVVRTTVEGRLDEWLPLAGASRSRTGDSRGITHRARSGEGRFEALEIRVRVLD